MIYEITQQQLEEWRDKLDFYNISEVIDELTLLLNNSKLNFVKGEHYLINYPPNVYHGQVCTFYEILSPKEVTVRLVLENNADPIRNNYFLQYNPSHLLPIKKVDFSTAYVNNYYMLLDSNDIPVATQKTLVTILNNPSKMGYLDKVDVRILTKNNSYHDKIISVPPHLLYAVTPEKAKTLR